MPWLLGWISWGRFGYEHDDMPGFNDNLIIFVLIPLLPSIIVSFLLQYFPCIWQHKNLTNLHESPRIATRFVEQAFWVSPLFGGGEQELIFELKRGPGESPCFLGFPAVIPEMDNSRKKLTRSLESSQKGGVFWYRWVAGFRSWDVFF